MSEHIADFAVIGLGVIGSAALRYLSGVGATVIGIGPDEPTNWKRHDGVFASHYDEGRITRVIDPDPDWADWAAASIAEYAGLEEATGIRFHAPVGCLRVGVDPDAPGDTVKAAERVGQQRNAPFTRLDGPGLAEAFPFLHFPQRAVGLIERGAAGYINPRAMVRAQLAMAGRQGATIVRETALALAPSAGGVRIKTDGHGDYRARRVLIAAGSWTNRLLDAPMEVTVLARTVLLAEVDEEEATRLRGLPSIISTLRNDPYFASIYSLPAIPYPDGNRYLKIGGRDHRPITLGQDGLAAWFHSDGAAEAGAALQRILCELIPGLRADAWRTVPCVYTETVSGYPILDMVAPDIGVAFGGNGSAAKSGNEIGRRAAQMMLGL